MLLRLVPEQITVGWDVIRPLIAHTLPPTLRVSQAAMGNILTALLNEEAQLWLLYREEGDGIPRAFIMTTIITDNVAGSKFLLIYSMHGLDTLNIKDYENGVGSLKTFALANECNQVLAYVEDESFIRVLNRVGGVKVSNLVRL